MITLINYLKDKLILKYFFLVASLQNLIQSAVDGYNVCIFAYGQTGSGKTFTMIGDREQRFPGIAPRAFQRIFELGQENQSVNKIFCFTCTPLFGFVD